MREKFRGQEQIHGANGSGMRIDHIGYSEFKTPSRSIHLRKILYSPHANKNLLSVHRIALDNHVFLEFHPFFGLRIRQRGGCSTEVDALVVSIR